MSSPSSAGEDAVKKFGNAKSISSDMYFGGPDQVVVFNFQTEVYFVFSKSMQAYSIFQGVAGSLIKESLNVQDTRDANLSRFQGSASISSDMYFNRCDHHEIAHSWTRMKSGSDLNDWL